MPVFWSKWKKFLVEVRTELRRTTWPNRIEVRNTTLIVIVTTFIFAAFLGVVDLILSDILKRIFSAFSS
jgi:preprotein translocase subunit SecE